jgi:WD40 repeat protein
MIGQMKALKSIALDCLAMHLLLSAAQIFAQEIPILDSSLLTTPPESLQPRLGRVASILVDRCVGCHAAQDAQGGYSMSTPALMLTAGESKRPVIGPTLTDESGRVIAFPQGLGELWERITTSDPALRMPKDSDSLEPEQVEDLRAWIATGAKIDGSIDAPIESFLPVYIPSEPKLAEYPRPHTVQAIALDGRSKTVFTSGYHEVLVWRWSDRMELVGRIAARGRSISDLHFDPIQSLLWIASGEPGRIGYVESVPIQESQLDPNPKSRRTAWVSRDMPLDISVSPNGELIGIGNADGTIVVIDTLTYGVRWRMAAHASAVTSMDWSRDGKTLLSSSRDRMGKSFQAQDGTMLSSFVDNERTVASIVALNRGLVTFDEAGLIRFYPNATTPNARTKRGGFPQQTHKLVAHNDDFFVIDSDSIKRFRVRREETEVPDEQDKDKQEDKKQDKKEVKKKKTDFYIDEKEGFRLTDPQDTNRRLMPLSMQAVSVEVDDQQQFLISVGCASGEFFVWDPSSNQVVSGSNRPSDLSQ